MLSRTMKRFIENLPDNFLWCRSKALHSYSPNGYRVVITDDGYNETDLCTVCTTKRTRSLTFNGYRVDQAASYTYPNGYLSTIEDDPFDAEARAYARLVLIRRRVDTKTPAVKAVRRARKAATTRG